jgi:hypothetical protein
MACPSPDQGEEGDYLGLKAIIFTGDNHTLFRTIAKAVLDNHMSADTCH